LLVGQRLHISHDPPLIRSWGIRHEKRFDIDEVLYQHCVKKLLVGYLSGYLSFLLSLKSDELRADGMILALRKAQKLSCRMACTLLGGDVSPVLSSWQVRGI